MRPLAAALCCLILAPLPGGAADSRLAGSAGTVQDRSSPSGCAASDAACERRYRERVRAFHAHARRVAASERARAHRLARASLDRYHCAPHPSRERSDCDPISHAVGAVDRAIDSAVSSTAGAAYPALDRAFAATPPILFEPDYRGRLRAALTKALQGVLDAGLAAARAAASTEEPVDRPPAAFDPLPGRAHWPPSGS